MMLKVDNEFLDFNDFVEVEKRVKLFEQLNQTMGDFSYSFDLPMTSKNLKTIGFPFPDVVDKAIYRHVNCDLLDESGLLLYKGFLRIEKVIEEEHKIVSSFFSGNSNWISLLTGAASDAGFSVYDQELNEANIIATWGATEGLVYPLLDTGLLIHRKMPFVKPEDFVGCIFVKTAFKKIFQSIGLKLNGDLLSDPVFNSLLVCNNKFNEEGINQRSGFAASTVSQPANTILLFDDFSTFPYYNGSVGNMTNSISETRYTADVKMRVQVEVTINITTAATTGFFFIGKNGSSIHLPILFDPPSGQASAAREIELEAGDYIYIVGPPFALSTIDPGSTFKVTPVFIHYTFGSSLVPNISKAEFISQVLNIFNVATDYDPVTKTLTIDLFDRIKSKSEIDISGSIKSVETDFMEFISSFGKRTTLSFNQGDDEDLAPYNVSEFIKYGEGVIEVDNDFIEDSAPLIESHFTNPVSYKSPAFSCSLERMKFLEESEGVAFEFTAVSLVSAYARFAIPPNTEIAENDRFQIGDVVRISETQALDYIGDWMVSAVGDGFVEFFRCFWDGSASPTGRMVRIKYSYSDSEDSFLLMNAGNLVVSDFSKLDHFYIDENIHTSFQYAFFNLLSLGLPVNDAFKQSLNFGSINNPLNYQRTLIGAFWSNTRSMLNDPVKLIVQANLSNKSFLSMTALRPVRVKTAQTNNLYYLNLISGYKGSRYACRVELIKL